MTRRWIDTLPGLALVAMAAYTIAWAWQPAEPVPVVPPTPAAIELPAPAEREARTVLACWGRGYDTGKRRPGAASNTYKIGTRLLLGCDTPKGYQVADVLIGQWGPVRKDREFDLTENQAITLGFKRAGVAPVDILEAK